MSDFYTNRRAVMGYGANESPVSTISHSHERNLKMKQVSTAASRVSVYAVAAAYQLGFRNEDLKRVRQEVEHSYVKGQSGGDSGSSHDLVPGLISVCVQLDTQWQSLDSEALAAGDLVTWLLSQTGCSSELVEALVAVIDTVQPLQVPEVATELD